jgi:REP element-mobilizing transposase RayT
LVAEVFGAIAVEKGHHIIAATVQPTHCHLIFTPPAETIDTVVARLKYRSAAAVLKRRREDLARKDPTQRVGLSVPRSLWTVGKFVMLITSWSHLENAIRYVERHNERDGLPAAPYDWITPLRKIPT